MRLARRTWFSLALMLMVLGSATAFAAGANGERPAIGEVHVSPAGVEWQPSVSYERLILTVSGPNDFSLTKEFESGKVPALKVQELGAKVPADGSYTWELRLVPHVSAAVKQKLEAARAAADDAAASRVAAEAGLNRPVVQSGSFMILSGSFVTGGVEPSAPGGRRIVTNGKTLNPATNDQVIADDLIVQGSACIGLDCVNNESFGFDTIRLKENNTRIMFDDTSTSVGFANHDWQLTANDSASGGANKFSIEDITAATVPFTVTGSSPTNSIFVASNGKVGFRTGTPVLDLHIATGDTPAIRQEQTTAGGFTAQTWDIGANEANWFVRDVTGGSRLPLRIRPGAPTSSIDISASGNVGIGTPSPLNKVHINTTTSADGLSIDGTNNPALVLRSGGVIKGYAPAIITTAAGFFTNSSIGDFAFRSEANKILFGVGSGASTMAISAGNVGIGTAAPTSKLQVVGLPVFANNAAAIAGGLTVGAFYRTGADPDPVCVVH